VGAGREDGLDVPAPGLFTQDAATIARVMADKKVSPKGPGSNVRTIQFFISRAGKTPERKQELEKTKRLLRARGRKEKGTHSPG
jgi:tRNA(adenine34) deaminase